MAWNARMKCSRGERRSVVPVLLTAMGCWSLMAGCQWAGPNAIANGRGAYNDMICRTGSEQTLQMMVRMRYDEPSSLLDVSSVTATVKFTTRAEAQLGFGTDEAYEGNLVPFAAGVAYEETPTISYRPVEGSRRISAMLSPLAVDTVVLIARADRANRSPMLPLLVDRVNDLRNPASGDATAGEGFTEAVELIRVLRTAGVAEWVAEPDPAKGIQLVMTGYAPERADQVKRLVELLNISGVTAEGEDIVLPVRMALGVGPRHSIDLQTRSVYDLLRSAVDGVQVPQEHLDTGIAEKVDEHYRQGSGLRVLSSQQRPARALVAVQHHGWWFYIDGTDTESKVSFVYLQMLLDMVLEGEVHVQSAPILTVPVGS